MLLTITTTRAPASDLGFLLHKHPNKAQTFDISVGTAHVFYPEATAETCTATLLLEVDPIALVRGRKGPSSEGFSLGQYVNDRPYAASSMLAVAMAKVFRTAMSGRCEARPELAVAELPLSIRIPALPCRGGLDLPKRFFEPLGWQVDASVTLLDEAFPAWGESRYFDVGLDGTMRLADALNHLYVLLPVLDDAKHYWVSPDEVDKLVRAGDGWLAAHPDRELITRRYLAHRTELFRTAVARLAEVDDATEEQLDNATDSAHVTIDVVDAEETPVPLAEQRRGTVLSVLRAAAARRVLDLGCGDGALLRGLIADRSFIDIVGTDVSWRALEMATRTLKLDRMSERERARITLFQSSLTYRDARLAGFDAAVLMEVIEHVDPSRLGALERALFAHARPLTVVVTTPNVEYNVRFESMAPGSMRHRDHRFEWSRAEFHLWADSVAEMHGYAVRYLPVGTDDPEVGPPTQMAVFDRQTVDANTSTQAVSA
ncbi:MAG: 3' terminal RNA ribose 2'-O-methyltransferase Hen1 [Acidothermaceae bacterium]